ncbi:pseudouridine synthase [Flavobacterium cheniae]|jgi:23S rRNA pseudouridine2605 synthase|uniref:23S rRNA pseudouridine2605 synthase n=1 Tax=Flavobacterium cheniae TaxID=295428 RepID=A0A562KFM3_9FLAO|nr:pseudouridine synthase [Flavobacterium cheniae]TDR20914.1 pseudouridine synthase [Flavobacterium cheniae]TWH94210.1 23S rRNA pseudouridine2605 synthase [Flavobacterium cheniae]
MSRHQDNDKSRPGSGRQGGYKKDSNSRGNAPIRKAPSKFATKPDAAKADAPKAPKSPKRPSNPDEIRLNRYISNSGMCSRRDADIYIQSGNVKVNGVVVTEMGHRVKLTDVVQFDGVNITPEKKEYVLLNKPKNFSTAGDDSPGSANVLDLVRGASKSNLLPVGRMDKTTTGLLLFTNDTEMVQKFTVPNQRSSKVYQVSLDKNLKFEDLEKIQKGLMIDDHKVFVEEITYIEDQPKSEIGIKMKTSNVKVVRKIFEHLKYDVLKVDRVTFAGLTKKNLPRGDWRFLTEQEIINLKNA